MMEMTDTLKSRLDEIKRRFPKGTSAVIPAIHAVQEDLGYIPQEIEPAVAAHLGIPVERIREVTTFYFLFNTEKVGKYQIYVCGNLTCWLRGYENILAHLQKRLGIGPGETTPDGRFTITIIECLCVCDHAPVIQIDGEFYGQLTPEKLDEIIDNLE